MNLHKEMLAAIIAGNLEQIKDYIHQDPEFISEDRDLLLSVACLHNHLHIVQYFVEQGADLNYSGNNYLRDVIRNENLELLRYLVEKGIDIHYPNPTLLYNPLVLASSIGNLDIVKYLIDELHLDIHQFNDISIKAAIETLDISKKHRDVIEYLVINGIDVNMDNGFVLHRAVSRNDMQLVKFLIENKADVNINDTQCLQTASYSKNFKMVQYLVEQGANVDANDGWPLQVSARDGNEDIVRYLVEKGADIHLRDEYALKLACDGMYNYRRPISNSNYPKASDNINYVKGIENIINFLIVKGADIHFQNEYCLQIAAQYEHKDMAGYFLQKGASPSFVYHDNNVSNDMQNWIRQYHLQYVQVPFLEKLHDDLDKVDFNSSIKKSKI